VNVRVRNGLTGGESVVEADVETVGLQISNQPVPDYGDQIPDRTLLWDLEFIDAADVFARHDKRMPLIHRIRICKRDGMLVLDPDSVEAERAEWAGLQG
jgi:hypothetical protein